MSKLPYSRKIWRFGGLYMAIPYQTAKFKSANILPIAILGSIAKFNSRQYLPYSQKIWRGIKFGGLAVYITIAKLKICQNFLLSCIRMAIPYLIAKFKSANILIIAIWGSTAKFNSRQYFRLYGTINLKGRGKHPARGEFLLPPPSPTKCSHALMFLYMHMYLHQGLSHLSNDI